MLSGAYRSVTISLLGAVALVSYNNLSVSAALPDIGNDLGSVSLLPWIITAELLAAAVAVLAVGPTVDGYGVRTVFRFSMVVFVVSSLMCAVASSMEMLVAFRILQGIAAGGVLGASISSIGLSYTAEMRPKVYAALSGVWGVMGIGGPALAAGLISLFGWRSIFSVTVPIGLTATAIGWSRLPGPRDNTTADRFDRVGLVLVTLVTVGLLVAASTASLLAFAWLAAAVLLGVGYRLHVRTVANPIVRMEHLTGGRWRYIHLTSTMAVAGGTGANAFLPIYLVGARGLSPGQAAFAVLFLVVGWTVGAYLSSQLQERVHPAKIVFMGSVVVTIAMALNAMAAGLKLHLAVLFFFTFFVGVGIGSVTTAGLTILQGRAQAVEMGRVSSAHQFVRSLGFSYGAAIGGLVLLMVVDLRIGDVEAVRDLLGGEAVALDTDAADAIQAGYSWALASMAAVAAVSLASAVKLVRNSRNEVFGASPAD